MSNMFDAIAWAIKVSRGEPMPARMLLIVGLAQRVGDDPEGFVWPSIKQICEDTDMGRTSVKRWMRHLQDAGLVEVFETKRDSGASGSNRYRLPIRAVFYHPTKGPMTGEGSKSDRGEGSQSDRGGVRSYEPGRGPTSGPRIEQPLEQPLEGIDSTPAELDLGIPPIPQADIEPSDVAAFISEEWSSRAFATPIRGGRLSEANIEKAVKLGVDMAQPKTNKPNADAKETWREIFEKIDASDFLQGRVPGRGDRPAFKLSISFLLEKRNFVKTLEGRFDGKSSGQRPRGSTSEATSRVLDRIRSGQAGSPGRRNQALAITGR